TKVPIIQSFGQHRHNLTGLRFCFLVAIFDNTVENQSFGERHAASSAFRGSCDDPFKNLENFYKSGFAPTAGS
ncbi:MAG TPA: hypothetical protein VM260_28435, partial [Pirellula sp.]|nr:hypothetical protein [Pirellula sp.]